MDLSLDLTGDLSCGSFSSITSTFSSITTSPEHGPKSPEKWNFSFCDCKSEQKSSNLLEDTGDLSLSCSLSPLSLSDKHDESFFLDSPSSLDVATGHVECSSPSVADFIVQSVTSILSSDACSASSKTRGSDSQVAGSCLLSSSACLLDSCSACLLDSFPSLDLASPTDFADPFIDTCSTSSETRGSDDDLSSQVVGSYESMPVSDRAQDLHLSKDVPNKRVLPSPSNDTNELKPSPLKRTKKVVTRRLSKWSKEEDRRLEEGVAKWGLPNWSLIAKHVQTRTNKMCAQRWRHCLRPEIKLVKKGKWSKEEDGLLRQIMSKYDSKNERVWDLASEGMAFTRSSIQCRERWNNFVDPNLRLGPWTEEEDACLLRLYDQLGNAWKKISSILTGRSSLHVRRRFNALDKIKRTYSSYVSCAIN